jgi:hypothetical protein
MRAEHFRQGDAGVKNGVIVEPSKGRTIMKQRRNGRIRLAALASGALIGCCLVGVPPASAGGPHSDGDSARPKVVATGLDNPRQLSFTASGNLLVAEAGEGGTGPCLPAPDDPKSQVCFGATGGVTEVTSRGKQKRIISGLPSIARQNTGAEAIGPSDVYGVGRRVSVLIGLSANPAVRAGLPAPGQRMGTLIQTTRNFHSFRTIADLAAWEAAHNPIDDPNSDPVGMLYEHGKYIVADAGGNTVLKVNHRGGIRLRAAFKDRSVDAPPFLGLPPGTQVPMEAVPTSVATKGHDGAYYVSELTGFPFPKGAARIYRIDPRTGKRTVYASGLTNVTDLAFRGRTLYAVQISTDGLLAGPIGSVVKVKPGGSTPADHTQLVSGLSAPYGIAIKGHCAYVTTHSTEKNTGEVVRIEL